MKTLSPEARKEMIRKKAQELYEKRGRKPGHELDDWLEAEKLIERDLQEETKVQPRVDLEVSPPIAVPISRTPSKVGSSKRP